MKCPHCQAGTSRVIETRASPNGIRRRHRCGSCRQTFASYNGTTVLPSALSSTQRALAGLPR